MSSSRRKYPEQEGQQQQQQQQYQQQYQPLQQQQQPLQQTWGQQQQPFSQPIVQQQPFQQPLQQQQQFQQPLQTQPQTFQQPMLPTPTQNLNINNTPTPTPTTPTYPQNTTFTNSTPITNPFPTPITAFSTPFGSPSPSNIIPPNNVAPPPSEPPTTPTTPPPTTNQQHQGQITKHKRVFQIDPEDQSTYDSVPTYGTSTTPTNQTAPTMSQVTGSLGNLSINQQPQGISMQYGTQSQSAFPQQHQQQQSQQQYSEALPLSISSTVQCPPTYWRMTLNAIPNTSQLLNKSGIPLGCVIHPLARPVVPEDKIPIVNFGVSGIVRCRRCRSYINPFVAFVEGGRRWKCNLCNLLNDVPGEYYCPTDSNGRRSDLNDHPELTRGCVEFIAPTEYMVRPPQPPVYFFCYRCEFLLHHERHVSNCS